MSFESAQNAAMVASFIEMDREKTRRECEESRKKRYRRVMENTVLAGEDFLGDGFFGKNLSGKVFRGCLLNECHLSSADLSGADLRNANLSNACLKDANLTGADLTGANLTKADLSGADLTGAKFNYANLCNARLDDANLTDADFSNAGLTWASFHGAYADDIMSVKLGGAFMYCTLGLDERLKNANRLSELEIVGNSVAKVKKCKVAPKVVAESKTQLGLRKSNGVDRLTNDVTKNCMRNGKLYVTVNGIRLTFRKTV